MSKRKHKGKEDDDKDEEEEYRPKALCQRLVDDISAAALHHTREYWQNRDPSQMVFREAKYKDGTWLRCDAIRYILCDAKTQQPLRFYTNWHRIKRNATDDYQSFLMEVDSRLDIWLQGLATVWQTFVRDWEAFSEGVPWRKTLAKRYCDGCTVMSARRGACKCKELLAIQRTVKLPFVVPGVVEIANTPTAYPIMNQHGHVREEVDIPHYSIQTMSGIWGAHAFAVYVFVAPMTDEPMLRLQRISSLVYDTDTGTDKRTVPGDSSTGTAATAAATAAATTRTPRRFWETATYVQMILGYLSLYDLLKLSRQGSVCRSVAIATRRVLLRIVRTKVESLFEHNRLFQDAFKEMGAVVSGSSLFYMCTLGSVFNTGARWEPADLDVFVPCNGDAWHLHTITHFVNAFRRSPETTYDDRHCEEKANGSGCHSDCRACDRRELPRYHLTGAYNRGKIQGGMDVTCVPPKGHEPFVETVVKTFNHSCVQIGYDLKQRVLYIHKLDDVLRGESAFSEFPHSFGAKSPLQHTLQQNPWLFKYMDRGIRMVPDEFRSYRESLAAIATPLAV